MAKQRGRKRLSTDNYFGPEEEEAVIKFLSSEDQRERDKIYEEYLSSALNKMIESIIRRYKLFRKNITYEELHNDTLSFLLTKAHKFEGAKGKKAYSYYGTICKHYLIGMLIKDERYMKQNISYDELLEDSEDDDVNLPVAYEMEIEIVEPNDHFVKDVLSEIKYVLEYGEFGNKLAQKRRTADKRKLTDDECKVGQMLVEILETWEVTYDDMEGSNKFNKLSILSSLREGTNLSTKDIRSAMKRYKELYVSLKNDISENN